MPCLKNKYQKLKATALLVFAVFIVFSPPSASAKQENKIAPPSRGVPSRSEVIAQEFDCIRQHPAQNGDITWENICYSPTDQSREKLIGEAMDEASYTQLADSSKDQVQSYKKKIRSRAALEENPSNSTQLALKRKNHQVELAAEMYYFTYKEPIFNLEDEGLMYGVYGAYTARPPEDDALFSNIVNMYKVDGRFAYGKIDYSSTPSGTLDNITDYTFEFRGILGKDYSLDRQTLITPYIGFGFRYLNDDTGGKQTTTGAYGYERESRYLYFPAGATLTHQLKDNWLLDLTAEYDIFIRGLQKSHLSDVPGGYPDLKNKQNSGFGVRGSVKLTKQTRDINFFLEPFIRYWHIDDSETATATGSTFIVTGLEPENKTTEFGARFGLEY